MSFDFLFFLEEVHVLGWSWLIGCLSVISVLCNHSFRELYHMWILFFAQDKRVSHGRSAFGGSCESFQELLSWWPWVSEVFGSRSWCPSRKPWSIVFGAVAAAEKNDCEFSTNRNRQKFPQAYSWWMPCMGSKAWCRPQAHHLEKKAEYKWKEVECCCLENHSAARTRSFSRRTFLELFQQTLFRFYCQKSSPFRQWPSSGCQSCACKD